LRFSAGLDLAQSSDFTALIICRRTRGLLRSHKYEAVFARRWRGTAYPVLVEEISSILNRQPFVDDVRLNLDATGVGAPILDLFERAKSDGLLGCEINPIIFSAANEPNPVTHTVPKKDLVTRLEVLLAEKRLDFARDLPLGPTIREELKNFGYKLSAAGKATFSAAGSGHDDLVSALALAVYEAPSPMFFSLNSREESEETEYGLAIPDQFDDEQGIQEKLTAGERRGLQLANGAWQPARCHGQAVVSKGGGFWCANGSHWWDTRSREVEEARTAGIPVIVYGDGRVIRP
jgi:hypothetical protein